MSARKMPLEMHNSTLFQIRSHSANFTSMSEHFQFTVRQETRYMENEELHKKTQNSIYN